MSDTAGRVGRRHALPRRRVAFSYHVLAEYVVAAALIAGGLRTSGATLLLLASAGIALVLLAACTRSRLGAFRALSPRAHHVLDLVLAALLALSPVLFHAQLHLLGVVLAEVVALVLLRVERGTTYAEAPRGALRPARAVASPEPAASAMTATTAGRAGAPAAGGSGTTSAEATAAVAAAAGAAAAAAGSIAAAAGRQLAPAAGRAARAGFRGLGFAAGAARRAARERSGGRGSGPAS